MNNFGSCCKDLYEAMNSPSNSFFRVESDGVFFLTVGYIQSEQETGRFDQAVIFCPFCGMKL
jgi:hypothetical protein